MSNRELAFEHHVVRPLRGLKAEGETWLLAVSGGVDSLVMAEVLCRWQRLLKVTFHVAHVHHGRNASPSQLRFRDCAQKLTRQWCLAKGVLFKTNEVEDVKLPSEASLRDYRLSWLRRWTEELQVDRIVLAHHADDLLETRMLRLMRGTGPVGLSAMSLSRGRVLRPLLECSRIEIERYARARKIKFVNDPSNRQTNALRNWLRNRWLPELEKRQPGSLKALARSLELLSSHSAEQCDAARPVVRLRREEMKNVSSQQREAMVAAYLRDLGVKNYGRTHVKEILKRIDTRQKNLTFEMLGVVFRVTPDLLWASRV